MSTQKYNIGQEIFIDGMDKKCYFIIGVRPLFGTYQYSLSETKGGEFVFACGEQSIAGAVDESLNNHQNAVAEPDLSFLHPRGTNPEVEIYEPHAAQMNTMACIMRQSIDGSASGIGEDLAHLVGSSLFFKPDLKFAKWLVKYANGRTIIDIGAGQGHLVRMLRRAGNRAIGIEPNFNHTEYVRHGMARWGDDFDGNDMLAWTVQEAKRFIQGFGDKALVVFARPCHSSFVYEGINNLLPGQEALYITVPENVKLYQDLGPYQDKAILLEHEGVSEDNEVVYSIKK